jgi:enolase-phosphatase E1
MTITCVLLDIEGTILPVTFVRDVLFPYSQRRMASFLRDQSGTPVVRRWAAVCLVAIGQEQGQQPSYEELPSFLNRWIAEDRKHPGLKALQGMIWEEGYRTGAFAPSLYEDVVPALRRWHGSGLRLALYSSGSEQAQRLLLEHTTAGNLTDLFSCFFDTSVGLKTEAASYRRIAELNSLQPERMLFLSDMEPELDAARAAGLLTVHVVRPGTRPGTRHPICSTFDDIPGELHPSDD